MAPRIRFKGFTDPWEQRKFGDLYRPTSEKNDLTFGRDRIISVANMHFSTEVYVTDDDYLRTYNVMRLGDIAFEGNRSGRFAHGRFVENTIGDGIVSHVFKVFRPRTDYDLNYWKYAIHNEATMRDALTRATKASTMMHELVSADFLEQITYAPSLPEQRQIGALFARLDSLITLHQRKYDKLTQVKKALLDKMFPKNGESAPELRFKGFTHPWEQRKLGDLVDDIATGKSVNSDDGLIGPGDVGIMKTSCVSYDSFDAGEAKRVVPEERSLVACPVEAKTLIVSRMNTPDRVGACGFVADNWPNLFLPDRLWRVRLRNSADPYLVYVLLTSDGSKEVLRGMASGTSGSMHNIPKESFLGMELTLPESLEEQGRIATQLASLDSLITLHQRKLELLKSAKKSLLEGMFV